MPPGRRRGGGPYHSLDGSDVLLVARGATDEICDFILSNDTFRYYGIPIVRSCGEEFGGGGSRRNNIMRSRATRGSIEASVARQAGERSHVHRRCEIHMPRHRKCRVVPSIIRIFVRTRARRSEVVTTLAARPPGPPLSSSRAALLLRLYVGPREREVMEVGCRNHHDQHTDVE